MSATDINLDVSYFKWPEVARLAGLLGRGTETLPLRLWAHCGEVHYEDGLLTDYTAAEVEAIVDWRGEKGKLVEALLKVGFLRALEGRQGFEVMYRGSDTWLDRNGHIAAYKAKGRAMARAKQALVRTEAAARDPQPPPATGSSSASATARTPDSRAKRAVQLSQSQRTNEERRTGGGDQSFPERTNKTPRPAAAPVVVAGFVPDAPPPGWAAAGDLVPRFTPREASPEQQKRARAERGFLLRRLPFGDRQGLRVQDLDAERAWWYLTEWAGRNNLDGHLRRALAFRVAQHAEESRR